MNSAGCNYTFTHIYTHICIIHVKLLKKKVMNLRKGKCKNSKHMKIFKGGERLEETKSKRSRAPYVKTTPSAHPAPFLLTHAPGAHLSHI